MNIFPEKKMSYELLNKHLMKVINSGYNINEETIMKSTNYIKDSEKEASGIFYTPLKIVDECFKFIDKEINRN